MIDSKIASCMTVLEYLNRYTYRRPPKTATGFLENVHASPLEASTSYMWWMHSVHGLDVASVWNKSMGIKEFDVTFLPIYQFFCVHNIQKFYFFKTSTCLLLYTTEFLMILYFFSKLNFFFNGISSVNLITMVGQKT